MTGTALETMINSLVDDTLDQTHLVNLLNAADGLISGERDWEKLKAIDSSKTWISSDTYTTTKALPTDFFAPYKLYVQGETRPWPAIGLADRERYKDIFGRWYIDFANDTFSLCGVTGSTRILYLVYLKTTTLWTVATLGSVSPWYPARFHPLLAFYVAGLHLGGVDSDDIAARMSPVNRNEFLALKKAMIAWDARLKMHTMNYAARSPDIIPGTRADVVGEGEIW